MKLTVMQKTMITFLQHPKELTAWDFRNGLTYTFNDERELFFYDYLPRQIHELEKVKLPSGHNIEFNRRTLKTMSGDRFIKYSIDVDKYSFEDVMFMSDMKNIKKVNILKTKTSNWLDKLKDMF